MYFINPRVTCATGFETHVNMGRKSQSSLRQPQWVFEDQTCTVLSSITVSIQNLKLEFREQGR